MYFPTVFTTTLLFLLSYLSFASAIYIPTLKGSFRAPSILQDYSPFSTPRQAVLQAAEGSGECTNGGNMYCCPSFIQSGIDGPCQDPVKVDMVQQCRKKQPHGMACCINEDFLEWYCWGV